MSFFDRNGDELAVNDSVVFLGNVLSVRELDATVEVVRQGNTVPLDFVRTEPVGYTVEDGILIAPITSEPVEKSEPVVILGTVTNLAPNINSGAAIVRITRNGETDDQTFFCAELIKVEVGEDGTITGALEIPT